MIEYLGDFQQITSRCAKKLYVGVLLGANFSFVLFDNAAIDGHCKREKAHGDVVWYSLFLWHGSKDGNGAIIRSRLPSQPFAHYSKFLCQLLRAHLDKVCLPHWSTKNTVTVLRGLSLFCVADARAFVYTKEKALAKKIAVYLSKSMSEPRCVPSAAWVINSEEDRIKANNTATVLYNSTMFENRELGSMTPEDYCNSYVKGGGLNGRHMGGDPIVGCYSDGFCELNLPLEEWGYVPGHARGLLDRVF